MPDEPFATTVRRLESMAAKLRTGTGPNYPMLARIRGEIETLAASPPEGASPLALAVIESLSQVTVRLMHDHPKFTDLIETHISALRLAVGVPAALDTAQADRLIADLQAATAKVFGKSRPPRR